jgi:tyrosyl-tRNA synthetase
LAKEIVRLYHGEKEAASAEGEFEKVFRNKELPSDMPVFNFDLPKDIVYLLASTNIASSKKEAWRLVNQKGVRFNDEVIEDPRKMIVDEGVLRVGRKFAKIKIK